MIRINFKNYLRKQVFTFDCLIIKRENIYNNNNNLERLVLSIYLRFKIHIQQ